MGFIESKKSYDVKNNIHVAKHPFENDILSTNSSKTCQQ